MAANANLYSYFQKRFPRELRRHLLITADGREVDYEEADQTSARYASCLLQMGAIPGDRVTVQVEKSVENLFLYLGCLRAGLIYHPLNTAYTASELEYFLADADPAIVICGDTTKDIIRSATSRDAVVPILTLNPDGSGTLVEKAISSSELSNIYFCEGSDIAALIYSSGTTGRPKGIMLSHDNLRTNARTLVDTWGFSSSDRLLHMLPIYHVHGLFAAISCVLMSGASMSWHNTFSDTEAVSSLPSCSVMMGVPTYYTRLLSNPDFGSECCSNMRLFISGSAPLLPETFKNFSDRCGHVILERYGMSETNMNTSNPLHGERRAGTVGLALPEVSVRVVNEEGAELKAGKIGNLQVKGPNVFEGYWRMPEKTAQEFTSDGFFDTGDKAVIDSNGYVSIVGRAKDLIISGGLNVYPKEVELVIDDMPSVKESAVVGAPHVDFGEIVIAAIVLDDSQLEHHISIEQDVITHCKNHLAKFKVPKRVKILDTLPRNAMGKVQKNLLRERFG